MSYEIPQDLKYEEKIVFGLTLKQFGWIALFGILAAVIYLKTGLDFYLKAIIAMALMGLGAGFAFLGFFGQLKKIKAYWFSVRSAGYLDKRLENFVEIKEIEHNALVLKDGSMRGVLQIVPLHFSLLSPEEQRAIISAYREFLNSLDFPVQIVMRTINLSLTEYLANLQKRVETTKARGLLEQFDSFKTFVQKLIAQKRIKNRVFYLVVPVSQNMTPIHAIIGAPKTDSESMLRQLDIRIKVCQDKLKRCNLMTRRLTTPELVTLTASFFEGFIEAQQDYFATITTLKGEKKHEENKRAWLTAAGQRLETKLG